MVEATVSAGGDTAATDVGEAGVGAEEPQAARLSSMPRPETRESALNQFKIHRKSFVLPESLPALIIANKMNGDINRRERLSP